MQKTLIIILSLACVSPQIVDGMKRKRIVKEEILGVSEVRRSKRRKLRFADGDELDHSVIDHAGNEKNHISDTWPELLNEDEILDILRDPKKFVKDILKSSQRTEEYINNLFKIYPIECLILETNPIYSQPGKGEFFDSATHVKYKAKQ
jgi:hypothetical protein